MLTLLVTNEAKNVCQWSSERQCVAVLHKQAPQTLTGQNQEKPDSAKEKVVVTLQSVFFCLFFFFFSHCQVFFSKACMYLCLYSRAG